MEEKSDVCGFGSNQNNNIAAKHIGVFRAVEKGDSSKERKCYSSGV